MTSSPLAQPIEALIGQLDALRVNGFGLPDDPAHAKEAAATLASLLTALEETARLTREAIPASAYGISSTVLISATHTNSFDEPADAGSRQGEPEE